MGLFNSKKNKVASSATTKANSNGGHLNFLDDDGCISFDWLQQNNAFICRAEAEDARFWKSIEETRYKSPKERFPALQARVMFLDNLERICLSKGEDFALWFHETFASPEQMVRNRVEVREMYVNLDSLQKEYEAEMQRKADVQRKVIEIKPHVIQLLKENDGILQSNFWKLFDDEISVAAASDILYALRKEGKLERTKSGRSFTLHYNGK